MAIRIIASLAKKLPLPGQDFSSQQASIEISAEVQDLSQIAAEAQRLYHVAEAAVDRQLGIIPPTTNTPTTPGPNTTGPRPANPPPRPSGNGRRSLATPSQLGLLQRLSSPEQVRAICEHHRVGQLADLSVKQASEVIDTLKSPR